MIADEEALLLLLKAPKKKYIKKLFELGAALNLHHNCALRGFETQISQNFQTDLELTKEQAHRLLIAILSVVETSCRVNFDFEQYEMFSESFDESLRDLILSSLLSIQQDIEGLRAQSTRQGRTLLDTNWRVDLQIANESGKANTPGIILEMESCKNGQTQSDKIQMKGEQFSAFFGNLKKIKDQLLQLVDQPKSE